MLITVCRKFLDVSRVQIKHFIWINAVVAFVLITITPVIFGIKNLDSIASSFILERFIALIGIILFTPLLTPELDQNVNELMKSKYTSFTFVSLVRLFLSLLILVAFIILSIFVMKLEHCDFNVLEFGFGTIATALFLGALGFAAISLSNNLVIGYMIPLFIYMLNMFAGNKLKMFYLFSLSVNSLSEKYWLLLGALLFILAGILYRLVQKYL